MPGGPCWGGCRDEGYEVQKSVADIAVLWIPDEALRALNPREDYGATEVLSNLDDFKPEQWGLP